jgi:hypothetical protein
LFVQAGDALNRSSWIPLYIYGSDIVGASVAYIPLYVEVGASQTSSGFMPLYVECADNVSAYIPIYVEGTFYETGEIPLYIMGRGLKLINTGPYDNDGYLLGVGELPIYIRRQTFSEMIPIFVMNEYTESSGEIPLYTYGVEGISTGEMPLYVFGFDTISGNIPLYIRGRS